MPCGAGINIHGSSQPSRCVVPPQEIKHLLHHNEKIPVWGERVSAVIGSAFISQKTKNSRVCVFVLHVLGQKKKRKYELQIAAELVLKTAKWSNVCAAGRVPAAASIQTAAVKHTESLESFVNLWHPLQREGRKEGGRRRSDRKGRRERGEICNVAKRGRQGLKERKRK